LEEVGVYLKKIKEFELAQRTPSPFIKDRRDEECNARCRLQ
jgi:hypothetical protein